MNFGNDATGGRALYRRALDFVASRDADGIARRTAVLALVIRITSAAIAYFAQVVSARLMGQFEYGLFAYTWVWLLVFAAFANIGFGDSPIRYIAQLRTRGEEDYLRGFLRFAPLATIIASVTFAALVIAVLPLFGRMIDHAYLMPMAFMLASIPFACLQAFLEAVGRSYNWTLPALLPNYILRQGLLLVIMIAAAAIGFKVTATTGFVCLLITMVISIVYQASAILLRLRHVVPRGPRAYRPLEWLRGSMPFAVLYASQHLSSFADVLVLSFFVSPAQIAVYFAATRIIQVVNLVPYAAAVGTAHLFSAAHTRGDRAELQRLCRSVAATTFSIAVVAVLVLVLGGNQLLAMFGHGFESAYVPLVILAAGVFARVAAGPAEDMLNMTGHGNISAATYLAVVTFNVVLAIVLVIPFGLIGAAVASAVALTLRAFWLSLAVWQRLGVRTSILAVIAAGGVGGFLGRSDAAIHEPAE